MPRLNPGDTAPTFTLQDDTGSDYSFPPNSGRRTVVYFYPAAGTPGCTTQACDFRDNLNRLTKAGLDVVGISPDTVSKLARFHEDEQLSFPVLSDPDHEVAEQWGAWGEKKNYGRTYEGLIRSTVVVDADGKVEIAQYNVRAKGHVDKLLRDLDVD